jgi:hypothetical protein
MQNCFRKNIFQTHIKIHHVHSWNLCVTLNLFLAPKYTLENSKILLSKNPSMKSQIRAYHLDFPPTKETPLSLLKTI